MTLTAGAGEPVAVTVNVPAVPTVKVALFALVMAGAAPLCLTLVLKPRTVMFAVRAELDVFAVKENVMTPFEMGPMVSQI